MPTHHTREQIMERFRDRDSFTITLDADDTAYDPETGDTLLGGVSIRYSVGEFPGPSYTAMILDHEPESACAWCAAVDDETCEGACRCPDCENERAAADDADAARDYAREV